MHRSFRSLLLRLRIEQEAAATLVDKNVWARNALVLWFMRSVIMTHVLVQTFKPFYYDG